MSEPTPTKLEGPWSQVRDHSSEMWIFSDKPRRSAGRWIVCSSLFLIYRGNCYEPISSRNELWRCACEIHLFVKVLGPKFGLTHVSHWVVQNLVLLFKYQTIVFFILAMQPKYFTWLQILRVEHEWQVASSRKPEVSIRQFRQARNFILKWIKF